MTLSDGARPGAYEILGQIGRLTGFVGSLGARKMSEVCRALAVAAGCDG